MDKSKTVGMARRFGRIEDEHADYAKSKAVILPVPLDRTTSWIGGTAKGPAAILDASHHMETWDEELNAETYKKIGITTLEAVDTDAGSLPDALARIEQAVTTLLNEGKDGKFPVILGGEHGLTPPCVAAAAKKYDKLGILQIDAHADLRPDYEGEPNSHACAMRRSLEHAASAVQVGIRSISEECAEIIPKLNTKIIWANDIVGRPRDLNAPWIQEAVAALPADVYLTIDLDAFDPAYMPATGTPEPGGLDWYHVTDLLRAVMRERNVVAMDVVELMPTAGMHACDFLAAKLIYRALGYRFCQ